MLLVAQKSVEIGLQIFGIVGSHKMDIDLLLMAIRRNRRKIETVDDKSFFRRMACLGGIGGQYLDAQRCQFW